MTLYLLNYCHFNFGLLLSREKYWYLSMLYMRLDEKVELQVHLVPLSGS